MKRFLLLLLAIPVVFLIGGCKKSNTIVDPVVTTHFRIGALLSITGTGNSTGESSRVSIELARQDVNNWMEAAGIHGSLDIVVADTRTDTAEALSQLKLLYDKGIRVVVGPYSSAEVAAIKPFADTHGMLVISPSSVAVSLAIPGDNIFRFVSSDVVQGQAMTKMLVEDGIRAIVPLIRNDVWGNDLLGATGADFAAAGGQVNLPVKFDPVASDFSAQLEQADAQVATLLASHPAGEIAIYLCSFGEGTPILAAAGNYPNLDQVSWYGSSAYALNAQLIADTTAGAFALSHPMPCPIFGLDEAAKDKWQPLKDRILAQIGVNPDVYALTAYDAVWVAMKTFAILGPGPDIDSFRQEFTRESASYFGVTGNTTLDENGDRAYGNYDFWGMRGLDPPYSWQLVARYNSATGTLTRLVR
jgi:branched-chain amino acid transport system substrate-binding protein